VPTPSSDRSTVDVLLVLRYRKAVTYGHHTLLAALEEHRTPVTYEVAFGTDAQTTVAAIRDGLTRAGRVLVLWSFYSPDALALAAELAEIRAAVDSPRVTHVAGGVHATAEPVPTLDAGWDVAAIGEGEAVLLGLVDAAGAGWSDAALSTVAGLAFRDGDGRLVRTARVERAPLDTYRAFPVTYRRFNPIEITRGCVYACRFCQTPFMFSARFRHRSVDNVRWHVAQMRAAGKRDVRFITPTSLSYGSADETPDLAAVEELLAACKEEIGPDGRVFFGSFPSEIRPEHISVEALRLVKRYCANDNLIVGAQSGSTTVLETAKRGHDVEAVRRAVHIGLAEGFTINVDIIFGMPGEGPEEVADTLRLAGELAEAGARIHAHTFMPLPGTPWRDARPGVVDPATIRAVDRLSQKGSLYGHWQRQREHAAQLADRARAYPRPGRSRTLPLLPPAPTTPREPTGSTVESQAT
jgi:B12-binding domain/radical SAM domain protein